MDITWQNCKASRYNQLKEKHFLLIANTTTGDKVIINKPFPNGVGGFYTINDMVSQCCVYDAPYTVLMFWYSLRGGDERMIIESTYEERVEFAPNVAWLYENFDYLLRKPLKTPLYRTSLKF
jgi:hypothetical protein